MSRWAVMRPARETACPSSDSKAAAASRASCVRSYRSAAKGSMPAARQASSFWRRARIGSLCSSTFCSGLPATECKGPAAGRRRGLPAQTVSLLLDARRWLTFLAADRHDLVPHDACRYLDVDDVADLPSHQRLADR